ncbi:MAG: UDP-N-acetylmuramate dehydrogenase, partial [Oscillospiraceae bacterium]|nr:UDP-N-acetylmuramate dehydrogenase [Oscillospiraceae bacterium]
ARIAKVSMTAYHAALDGLTFAHGIPGAVGGAVFMNAGAYGGDMSRTVASTEYLTPGGERKTLDAAGHCFGYRESWFSRHPEFVILSVAFKLTPGDKRAIKRDMDDLDARRRDKQPLMQPSAGSVFKRPEGHFAGALIEQCGLKGYAVGGALVSEKHAGFILNRGGATCRDVLSLMKIIQKSVHARTGVTLEPEIRVIGEENWN